VITYDKLIFELSHEGRKAYSLPKCDVDTPCVDELIPREFLSDKPLNMPQVSEVDIVRHYTNLSSKNYCVDTGFYPLGSCTMKYNPKINEEVAAYDGFGNIHPLQPEETVQGALEVMYELRKALEEITGMYEVSLQPAAGAHGELTGLMVMKAYHRERGEGDIRRKIIVPDSAHGTNPASAAVLGYEVIEVESNENGDVDMEKLREILGGDTAGMMLTNPNTLGLFEPKVKEICDMVHAAGGLMYYDGANANAILGIARPGDMGFDIIHLNLHKTFSTPHGGGGPGSGPIGVRKDLAKFLPVPAVEKHGDVYTLDYSRPKSIGKVKSFYGHFAVCVKAYAYILSMGAEGLKNVSVNAVINANYLMSALKGTYRLPIDRLCKHEFVLGGIENDNGITTLDIAKRLIDYGFHPPTVYFPLTIKEAMMIEPTETESVETLDSFISAMLKIAEEARTDPGLLKGAPHNTPVRRVDEVLAARNPVIRYI
jgi:glycine dehydrogenase subunit 2